MSTAPFTQICWSDPAIDFTRGDAAAYYSTRDVKHLAFFDGARAAVFHCRPLTRPEIREVRNETELGDRYEAAFRRGLTKVTNLVRADGTQRDWTRPDDGSGKEKPIPDAALGDFDEAEIQEIGMVIVRRSFLTKRSGGHYPLPAICQDALRANTPRRVEPTSASSSSAQPKPEAEEPPAAT
jgi:hypothetical protein